MTEQQNEPPPKDDALITVAGGEEMEVTHLDGTKESVKVRQIPATKLQTFMQKLGDEATSVAIYCDKDLKWVDTLDLSSVNAVVEKGNEINAPFLNAWLRRQAKWREMMSVGAIADLQKKVQVLTELLQSGNFAPQSPTDTNSAPKK